MVLGFPPGHMPYCCTRPPWPSAEGYSLKLCTLCWSSERRNQRVAILNATNLLLWMWIFMAETLENGKSWTLHCTHYLTGWLAHYYTMETWFRMLNVGAFVFLGGAQGTKIKIIYYPLSNRVREKLFCAKSILASKCYLDGSRTMRLHWKVGKPCVSMELF